MDVALLDAALEIAHVPELTPELLAAFERSLLFVANRDGIASLHAVQAQVAGFLTAERAETLFYALVQAGALTRLNRNRRGHSLDQYRVKPADVSQMIRDAIVARYTLQHVQQKASGGGVELVATLPDSLPLSAQDRERFLPLAAVLHRLVTEAEQEILILSPFFEQAGFDRLGSALLAAATRGVAITIISRDLSDCASVNYRVLSGFARETLTRGLADRFSIWDYQLIEGNRIMLASHAKALVVDNQNAYVGSANLTEHGLSRSVEIGVLLRGPQVSQVRQVFQAILQSNQARRLRRL